MYALLGIRSVLRLYGAIAALCAALLVLAALLLAPPSGAADWATMLGRSVGLGGLLAAAALALLGHRRVLWPMLRLRARLTGQAPFPDINGRWKGTVTHNWPLIDRVHRAARGEPPRFDAEKERVEWGETPVEATITADLFRVGMETKSDLMDSQVLAVWPLPAGPEGHPRLAYLYRAKVRQTRAKRTDVEGFDGAAIVKVVEPGEPQPLRLEGEYWTNRGWSKAMSTAGEIHLVQVTNEPRGVAGGPAAPAPDVARRGGTG